MSDDPVELAGGDVVLYYDRFTGTDTDRSGYQRLMGSVESGDVDAVVSDAVARVSRSVRDLDRTADHVVDQHKTELHLLKEEFGMLPDEDDPYQKAMFRLLGVFAELEADLAQLRTKEGVASRIDNDDYHHGRAPLGSKKRNGGLIPGNNYDHVVSVLKLVDDGELSKRKAAAKLDTSRCTINRSLNDRRELYGL